MINKKLIAIMLGIFLLSFASPIFWRLNTASDIGFENTGWVYQINGQSMIAYDFERGYGENAYNAHKQPLDARIGRILTNIRNNNLRFYEDLK